MSKLDLKSLKGITQDSRAVKKGYLFAALRGTRVNGCDYVGDAVRNGASAILIPSDFDVPKNIDLSNVAVIKEDNPRLVLANIAAEYYGLQPDYIIAVTGTNGKTSTVTFAQQIWQMMGLKSASLGTLGLKGANEIVCVRSGSITTPDPVSLHAELADLASAGVTHLAMEASSHGLDQYRLHGVNVRAAGFTNLTRDHMDYHGTEEAYLEAKMKLFTEVMGENGTAVLNADIEQYGVIRGLCETSGHQVLSYGYNGEDLKIIKCTPTPTGQKIALQIFGEACEITLPLVGEFQLMNVLCALGLIMAQSDAVKQQLLSDLKILEKLNGVSGRLQLVSGHPKNAAIYIDYAHTPDALSNVLLALKAHKENRLICMFGCGGDRDAGKRPLMGRIAQEHADLVIVTDDNPRSEDPAKIRKDVMRAAPSATEIAGRRKAIERSVAMLEGGDILVIAGKGHEQGQIFDGYIEDFDDANEARKAIEKLKDG